MHYPQPKSQTIFLVVMISLLAACSPSPALPSPTIEEPVTPPTSAPTPGKILAPSATLPPTNVPPTLTATTTLAPSSTPAATTTHTREPVTALTLRWVDVYAGPGEAYPLLASFAGNIRFIVTGRNEAGDWLQVEVSPQIMGWITGSSIELAGDGGALAVIDLPAAPFYSPTPVAVSTARIWANFIQYNWVSIKVSGLLPKTYYVVEVESDRGKVVLRKGFKSSDTGTLQRYEYITSNELRLGVYALRLYLNDVLVAQSTFTVEKPK